MGSTIDRLDDRYWDRLFEIDAELANQPDWWRRWRLNREAASIKRKQALIWSARHGLGR